MTAQVVETRGSHRPEPLNLRKGTTSDNASQRPHSEGSTQASDEEHSVMDDDSSQDEGEDGEYMDDDDVSSSLSIPNESIDFDLVYSLHNFAATVEGQASVVKGDSLFLMDDSNSYWWLVRVLTTQEVGYIPAENIETPFERLARLNKHRNVDLASATQEELQEDVQTSRDRMRGVTVSRNGQGISPSDATQRKSVVFTGKSSVFNYPPAVWGDEEEEDEEWDEGEGDEGEGEFEEEDEPHSNVAQEGGPNDMEPDDGMSWDGAAIEDQRAVAQGRMSGASVSATPTSPVAAPAMISASPAVVTTALPQTGRQPSPSPITISPQQPVAALRLKTSRERLLANASPTQGSPGSPLSPAPSASTSSVSSAARMFVDSVAAGDTRKISMTPSIAREAARQSLLQNEMATKRAREEAEETTPKKKIKDMAPPVSSASMNIISSTVEVGKDVTPSGGKLRKGRESPAQQEEEGGKEKKKKSGVFGGLFGRKKDKSKEKDKVSESLEGARASEDSTRSGSAHGGSANGHGTVSPQASSPPATAMRARSSSSDSRRSNAGSTPTPGQTPSSPAHLPPSVSQHSLKMQQIDQQQQALYQQYLKSSPASNPGVPSYGLQSASSVMPNSSGSGLGPGYYKQGGRPGSLILTPTGIDGQGMPELSVIRVFAGTNLHTEATFKTVLLNASTTSADLIRQAMQRFRLAAGEDAANYYLEIKQVEGSSAVLLPQERPLGVFESLVEEAQLEVPRVKRSSMGSISSVSSALSMHPAIKKLSMNDFTDDSAVKFYLNRRTSGNTGAIPKDADDISKFSVSEDLDLSSLSPQKPSLTVTTANGTNVTPERFSSPSSRFALQVVILPDDLPDGVVFDPHTEAIVPKSTLRDRSLVNAAISPGVSQTQRRKVLQFPRNTTVAEVIELALERFGIAEGVVDGGDEVEDKLAKRVSLARVRYGLAVQVDSQERHLQPSSKVLDAFSRPPVFKPAAERRSGEKRRSADSTMLLGLSEDVRADDPTFFLRRAVGFRKASNSRMSAPLDEIALQHLHQRESASLSSSDTLDESKPSQQQMSRQELIAAQRAASRANQRALLSAQSNSQRGVDVMLPGGNALLRSSLHETGDKMRYSYVQDGETYDISDIVEEEQRDDRNSTGSDNRDWLEGVVARSHEGLGDNLDRLLIRIRGNKPAGGQTGSQISPGVTEISIRSSVSSYSEDGEQEGELAVEPVAELPPVSSRAATPSAATARATSSTPTGRENAGSKLGNHIRGQPSVASVMLSDGSSPVTSSPETPVTKTNNQALSNIPRRRPLVIKGDFGISDMISIIELAAASKRSPAPPAMDHVDEILFGSKVSLEELHPRVREMFGSTFMQLDDMDRQLDRALAATLTPTSHAF